ncbi:MAG: branched-chain amino acid ABC transporter permease [Gemmiger sp.]
MEKSVKKDALIGLCVTVAYAVAGTMFGETTSNIMSYVLIMTLFGLSFNLQFGYAGMTSLGHAMYFGTGGYVLVALCLKAHLNVWLACLLTLVICAAFYTLCGIVCLKNNMMTFTFLSMGISLSVSVAVSKWIYMGGTVGLNCKIAPAWMDDYRVLYLFILAVVAVCTVLIYMLSKSPFVCLLKGGRENEERLIFLGVNTNKLHTVVFVISGMFAAVAGMLFAFRNNGAFVASLDSALSFEAIIMCVVGGASSFFGPVLGGLIVALVYNFLPQVTEYYQGFLGFFVLLIVYFMREGLLSGSNPIFRRLHRTDKPTIQG